MTAPPDAFARPLPAGTVTPWSDAPDADLAAAGGLGESAGALFDFFRDTDAATDDPLLWRIAREQELSQALSGLFHGPAALVQLRLWAFLQLARQGEAQLARERIDELFHALRPEALETVLKRFRDVGLLAWDDSLRAYALPPLAQRVAGLLAPLANSDAAVQDTEGGELAALLGQVVGANQLGALDPGQLQMLQAQLTRLHGEFADAIASGSEFRLRAARQRYDRAAQLIDRASDAITAIIGHAHGHIAMERAARALGQAQSRLLAMASQFNRALQQVDRQRVTLGTTGITSTDVKRWLQTLRQPGALAEGALAMPVGMCALAPHELLDVTEAEFERDRPTQGPAEDLPGAQEAPVGTLSAVALPRELGDLADLLSAWAQGGQAAPRDVAEALLGAVPASARYAQVAYKAQLLPLLGDPQAGVLPGATGALARQPWRVQWEAATQALDHAQVELMSCGHVVPADWPADTPAAAQAQAPAEPAR
ncbi:hypothetical protein M4R22_09540 [Acidovorax sp. GBBC 3334]|uniref:hypothetical protein n=1 Tax=Acidovorax sp. GBBC 3334 TaxID=2940496 RepID=UPI0023031860|nr:hypothetical protein [Acidovorax sp. GBBC 3334]MDA8455006.1 hypothetical protein [Acidovorax sp. GBBC 3334]